MLSDLVAEKVNCQPDHPELIKHGRAISILMKLANKSGAHFTKNIETTTEAELELLPEARLAIYRIVIDCVRKIDKKDIWWHNEVEIAYDTNRL